MSIYWQKKVTIFGFGFFSTILFTQNFSSGWAQGLSPKGAADQTPKIILVILENTNYKSALRQSFLGQLAKGGTVLTNYFAVAHPSQPNYIALVAGNTLGITDDSNHTLNDNHLGDLLEAKGRSWKTYAEGLPSNCFLGGHRGAYVRKHNPFISFSNVQKNANRCSRIQDEKAFANDFLSGNLADFSIYVPDLNNDGHDTGVAFADKAMAKVFSPLINSKTTMDYLLFFTFDEDDYAGNNQVLTIITGPKVKAGIKVNTRYNHYSLLRTIEDIFGLGNLGREDAKATAIQGFLQAE